MTVHNHNLYGINELKQPGECPACDERWATTSGALCGACPFCEKLIRFTLVIILAMICPYCHKKWYGEEAVAAAARFDAERGTSNETQRAENSQADP